MATTRRSAAASGRPSPWSVRGSGLAAGPLLFCTDTVTLPGDTGRRYRGLAAAPVRAGLEAALDAAVGVLSAGSTA